MINPVQINILYTKHALEKLKRPDIKKLTITKEKIEGILNNPEVQSRTKYNDLVVISSFDESHDLRVIYDIIDGEIKVITFHIARKGRYK